MSNETKSPMTPADASRIQGTADRTGTNADFKSRAAAAAAKNTSAGNSSGSKKK